MTIRMAIVALAAFALWAASSAPALAGHSTPVGEKINLTDAKVTFSASSPSFIQAGWAFAEAHARDASVARRQSAYNLDDAFRFELTMSVNGAPASAVALKRSVHHAGVCADGTPCWFKFFTVEFPAGRFRFGDEVTFTGRWFGLGVLSPWPVDCPGTGCVGELTFMFTKVAKFE